MGIVEVVLAIDSTTAAARGSRGWLEDAGEEVPLGVVVVGLRGPMAFSVRARMAFCDFLVPKERPRAAREESCCEVMLVNE